MGMPNIQITTWIVLICLETKGFTPLVADLWRKSWSTTSFQGFSPKCSDKNTKSWDSGDASAKCCTEAFWTLLSTCLLKGDTFCGKLSLSILQCTRKSIAVIPSLKMSLQKDILGTKKCSHGLLIQDFHGFPTIYKMMFCMKNWKVIQDFFPHLVIIVINI